MAMRKFTDETAALLLNGLRKEHRQNAAILRRTLMGCDAGLAIYSGVWSRFAQVVENGPNLLGESPALRILLQGEEQNIADYQAALQNPLVCAETKLFIQTQLLPLLHHHLLELKLHRDHLHRDGTYQEKMPSISWCISRQLSRAS